MCCMGEDSHNPCPNRVFGLVEQISDQTIAILYDHCYCRRSRVWLENIRSHLNLWEDGGSFFLTENGLSPLYQPLLTSTHPLGGLGFNLAFISSRKLSPSIPTRKHFANSASFPLIHTYVVASDLLGLVFYSRHSYWDHCHSGCH